MGKSRLLDHVQVAGNSPSQSHPALFAYSLHPRTERRLHGLQRARICDEREPALPRPLLIAYGMPLGDNGRSAGFRVRPQEQVDATYAEAAVLRGNVAMHDSRRPYAAWSDILMQQLKLSDKTCARPPHLRRDWARPGDIWAGNGLASALQAVRSCGAGSAPGRAGQGHRSVRRHVPVERVGRVGDCAHEVSGTKSATRQTQHCMMQRAPGCGRNHRAHELRQTTRSPNATKQPLR